MDVLSRAIRFELLELWPVKPSTASSARNESRNVDYLLIAKPVATNHLGIRSD